jgi:hypothetical protein
VKRLATFLFLALFLFNVGGYYFVFLAVQHQASHVLTTKLDDNLYNEDELVVLKLPLSLPYPVGDNEEFERISGSFHHAGSHYQLVKQRVYQDTLVIVCIKDVQATHIGNVASEFSKVVNELPTSTKQTNSYLSKLFKDYKSGEIFELLDQRHIVDCNYYAATQSSLVSASLPLDTPPPEMIF